MNDDRQHWADRREAGSFLGMNLLFACYRFFGRPIFKAALFPVLVYFFVFHRAARAASLDYTRRLQHCYPELNLKPGWRLSYHHFNQFANVILEKLDVWMRSTTHEEIIFNGREHFLALMAQGRGAVFLSSHLGNLEVCSALSRLVPALRLNLLVHTKHAHNFNRLLRRYNHHPRICFIQVTDLDAATAIALSERIEQGEMIAIVGDRVPVTDRGRTITADFLGSPAAFPQGPLILASLLKCPVYTLFCLKEQGRYHIYCEPFSEQILLPRARREQALTEYMQCYAARLEHYCTKAPLQWYNFYPFWQQTKNKETARA